MRQRLGQLLVIPFLALAPAAAAWAQGPSFLTFESGQVRPLAFSPDGTRLFAVNTPDGQLEIFDVGGTGNITWSAAVPVGMEPVAVAARTNTEVWVVNHLSDSVSIVSLAGAEPRVVRTLLVGDEPSDIVFAGPGGNRAFITTAHRGQNSPHPYDDYSTPGLGRADVWTFDGTNPGTDLGGTPLSVITLFADKARALAVGNGGATVYAAAFHSGNRTTTVSEGLVCNTSAANMSSNTNQGPCVIGGTNIPGGYPRPHKNQAPQSINRPETGLIVQFNRPGSPASTWSDELDRNWNAVVRFNLPDRDVFAINANANPPAAVDGTSTCANGAGCWAGVGTVLFNMIVNPVSGKIYVSNTDAQNHVRFEGPGTVAAPLKPAGEPATVQGNLAQSRITVLDGASVLPRHLNKHINYAIRPAPAGVKANSLSTPVGMAVTSNGATLYVAAVGSNKVGIFNTATLENNTFTPSAANHIQLSGGGPSGLVLREGNLLTTTDDRLYVLNRFDNTVSVVDITTRNELQVVSLHNPEPDVVVDGRPFLYDAVLTSSNGEASCASCHIFGDLDDLAWDLGNPDDDQVTNTNDFNPVIPAIFDPLPRVFHPMKGPMTTQSLRGLQNMGPEHWRGDRQGDGIPGNAGGIDEVLAFEAFNVAFPGLVGRAAQLSGTDMTKFREFIMEMRYPPNPIRQLSNALRTDELNGRNVYFSATPTDTVANCNGCHTLNAANGFFGGNGQATFEGETQHFKVPHLRNVYQKVGMFGLAQPGSGITVDGPFTHQGDQIRGYGVLHDGSVDTVFRFTSAGLFSLSPTQQEELEAFIMAFDSDLAPIVGQQITLTSTNAAIVNSRINLLIQRAGTAFTSKILGGVVTECDLIAKGVVSGDHRGFLFLGGTTWSPDRESEPTISTTALRALANTAGQELTFTCVPPGSGIRAGIDRDEDGFLDRDELDAGSDPADPGSTPGGTTSTTSSTTSTSVTTTSTASTTSTTLPEDTVLVQTTALRLRDDSVPPVKPGYRRVRFRSATRLDPPANRIAVPALGSAGDPTQNGGTVAVYNSASGSDLAIVPLPPNGWTTIGGSVHKGYRYRDPDPDAAIRRVRITANRIAVMGGKQNWTYTLDEPTQGRVGVRVALGTGVLWCAEAGQPGFPPRRDEQDRYVAARRTPAPSECPEPPPGSPSGAFLDGDASASLY
jgi:YVTN family beta-propeller protein